MPIVTSSPSGGGCGGVGTISAPTTTVGDTTSETTIFTFTVIGCTIKANGLLRYSFTIKSRSNVGFAMTPAIKITFGGTTVISNGSSHQGFGASHRTSLAGTIQNLNATNSQDAFVDYQDIAGTLANYDAGSVTGGTPTHQQTRILLSKDTLADQILAVTFKWSSAPNQNPSAQCIADYVEVLD